MGLWLLANTVSRDAAELRLTDTSHVEIPSPEADDIDNIRGGPRHLGYTRAAAVTRHLNYVNTGGGLAATHLVVTEADALSGLTVNVNSWSDYSATSANHFSSVSFGEPLIGIDGTDWCRALGSLTAKEAFGISPGVGGAAVRLGKVYFCAGQEFLYRAGNLEFSKLPAWAPAVLFNNNWWKLHGTAEFALSNLTAADVDAYLALPRKDAVFFYDDTGAADSGNFLPHKLWHAIILDEVITEVFDDFYLLQLRIGILKHGDG